jgi:hypothetical protein
MTGALVQCDFVTTSWAWAAHLARIIAYKSPALLVDAERPKVAEVLCAVPTAKQVYYSRFGVEDQLVSTSSRGVVTVWRRR